MSDTVKKLVFVAGIGMAVILFFFLTENSVKEDNHSKSILAAKETGDSIVRPAEEVSPEYAIVDIKGEVNKPGVYEISLDSRVNDVIELAGGFTDHADTHLINLAQKIQDEMSIIVYKKGDENNTAGSGNGNAQGKVRINYATVEEIQSLNGIGPSKAQAIIQYREEHGLFQVPEDLLNVSGIGEKTLQNFIDQIQVP
ncbi:helix-hairpin-helix domain-containing protein [Oceanobacillus luteolus]|uniref:helix-hairpin-helix domain-containing protein n=1 Tax=Oceanobacillus luteolus TaxID=1274358 RepID=UPI00203EED17|nr:helix-hairpin-helix domain-containing protein [Oceanobacillus luteolus]MCM3738676.1 helix-hairpin-helix domain-containing protein [Oceanobacillus luteolus]